MGHDADCIESTQTVVIGVPGARSADKQQALGKVIGIKTTTWEVMFRLNSTEVQSKFGSSISIH